MFGWNRKNKEAELAPPPGLNTLHGFEAPSDSAPYIEAKHTFASRIGRPMPRIPNQDALLIHDDRPPADMPAGDWYRGPHGKSQAYWDRSQQNEHVLASGPGDPFQPTRHNWTGNPNIRPPDPSRIMRAPAKYSFVKDPGANRSEWHLTGNHASMATIQKTYQPLGMTPAYRNRNTYRADPPPRDAYIVDMPSNADTMNRTTDSVYVSPDLPSAPSGLNRSFRLS